MREKQPQTNNICPSERTAAVARFRDSLPIRAEISKSGKIPQIQSDRRQSCACQRLGSNMGIPAWDETTVSG